MIQLIKAGLLCLRLSSRKHLRPSKVSKHSWLAVTLVEFTFPLAVGFSERLRWIPESNPAASVPGICALHGSRQLLAPWMQAFGYLSSYGISNCLDGFLGSTFKPASRLPLL